MESSKTALYFSLASWAMHVHDPGQGILYAQHAQYVLRHAYFRQCQTGCTVFPSNQHVMAYYMILTVLSFTHMTDSLFASCPASHQNLLEACFPFMSLLSFAFLSTLFDAVLLEQMKTPYASNVLIASSDFAPTGSKLHDVLHCYGKHCDLFPSPVPIWRLLNHRLLVYMNPGNDLHNYVPWSWQRLWISTYLILSSTLVRNHSSWQCSVVVYSLLLLFQATARLFCCNFVTHVRYVAA